MSGKVYISIYLESEAVELQTLIGFRNLLPRDAVSSEGKVFVGSTNQTHHTNGVSLAGTLCALCSLNNLWGTERSILATHAEYPYFRRRKKTHKRHVREEIVLAYQQKLTMTRLLLSDIFLVKYTTAAAVGILGIELGTSHSQKRESYHLGRMPCR
ncbi:PREDICTED: uncharacterized protein LOC104814237 isoform X2 [Tarenaya hassleriana]|uniref:uncharacterized protein LOC104814237 isoform X2 n=1 Tax=Tarenaya hassleriana TaxID=28532 RepID=UPI00053C31FB|nr:PREDICTED: uncharacterized protein LOC104814237 isoform X2 [Tarenaya hassleriana]